MHAELWQDDFTAHKVLESPTSTLAGSFSEEHQKLYIFHLSHPQEDSRVSLASGEKVLEDVMNWF